MKKFIYAVLITILGFSFTSCKKQDIHKITYEVIFLQTPSTGSSDLIEITAKPSYSDLKPAVDRLNIPQKWTYEYVGLEKGQKVTFGVRAQLSYYYEMRVYIDGVQVSYMKVKVSDNTYYDDHVEEHSGLNDNTQYDTGLITFTYN
jgi:hypothetical protein